MHDYIAGHKDVRYYYRTTYLFYDCMCRQKLGYRISTSLLPRPRIRREKWPGIHCLHMCERFRKFSTNKLLIVVMQRNNQTRYTACSVAAVFTRQLLFIICCLYLTETSLLPRPRTQLSNPSRQPTTSCQL